ncbi:nucleotidyltransferase family protein [Oleispirillum naphthae]|uniref:nucleotidyltransferase family protein n=1 Tax=Oleispirillum naphthae TaxID=2838853 RepID=UPI0030823943
MIEQPLHVLILAGRRGGDDPVARAAGVSHKALAAVGGVPMIERVVMTLREALPFCIPHIAIDATPEVASVLDALADKVRIEVVPAGASPCATVAAALDRAGTAPPLLVTTADHPLLTPAMVRHFLDHLPAGAGAAAGVAARETITARYPAARRTYWRFGDRQFSGCNLFYLGPGGGAHVVAFWRRLERDRKRPWAVVRRLGLGPLLRFGCGRLSLAQALRLLEDKVGARVIAVDMPFAEAAIDVDRPADLRLAEEILGRAPP